MKKNATGIQILISSDCNYNKLVAEMYCDGKYVALLNQDNGIENIQIEFSNNTDDSTAILSKLDLEVFLEMVRLARTRLSE